MAKAGPNQPDLTALIVRATNPLNEVDDPNLVQSICQEIGSEPTKVQLAMRLIIHKMQSPNEREAMQALLVLQACVNNCGETFYSEVGKFRFLNEMIKLVSPKYFGNQTSYSVKTRIFELLYTWTIDLKQETKISEAYDMLKTQGVLKHDPAYLGSQVPNPVKPQQPASFEDEQKSRLLQRLLQSRRPEDINKANALIKSMVKEDEQKLERTSKRIVEVETALNNVKVLDDMITQCHNSQSICSADLDLMAELFNSCHNLRWNIYRTVSEMEDRDDGIGDFVKASEELSSVMSRYKLEVEAKSRMKTSLSSAPNSFGVTDHPRTTEDSLLDLAADTHPEVPTSNLSQLEGLAGLDVNSSSPGNHLAKPDLKTSLGDLQNMFSSSVPVISSHSTDSNRSRFDLLSEASSIQPVSSNTILSPSSALPISGGSNNAKPSNLLLGNSDKPSFNPLSELDQLGCELLKQSLPPNIKPVGAQFRPQDKVSLNEMRQCVKPPDYDYNQQAQTTQLKPDSQTTQNTSVADNIPLMVDTDQSSASANLASLATGDIPISISSLNSFKNTSLSKQSSLIDSEPSSEVSKQPKIEPLITEDVQSDSELLSDLSVCHVKDENNDSCSTRISSELLSKKLNDHIMSSKNVSNNKSNDLMSSNNVSKKSNMQLSDVKPITDINIALEDIKPGKQSSVPLLDSDGVSLVLHFTENRPREDVSIVVVSVTSQCSKPISNYMLQAVGPKGCKVRLQPPSSTHLVEYSPFLPPPAITQIMLIANPNQLNVSLKVMLSYCIDEEPVSTMGEIDHLPL